MQHPKEEKENKKKMGSRLPMIHVEAAKQTTTSTHAANDGTMRTPSSARAACLCSPTTHAGSFRCRLHRTNNNLNGPSSSFGSNLSELGSKSEDHKLLQPQ
uniref:Uncharacterized protein n=1 Tax=Kalanchoe fedtschenkoi TaxID=63787 RepID=A0A7N0RC59_KALFE